jgi:hypothetical protein
MDKNLLLKYALTLYLTKIYHFCQKKILLEMNQYEIHDIILYFQYLHLFLLGRIAILIFYQYMSNIPNFLFYYELNTYFSQFYGYHK